MKHTCGVIRMKINSQMAHSGKYYQGSKFGSLEIFIKSTKFVSPPIFLPLKVCNSALPSFVQYVHVDHCRQYRHAEVSAERRTCAEV